MTQSSIRPFSLAAPLLAVFLANAAVMTIELTAGKLISPHLGMSLYTWTGVIGAVMAGMALGNGLGGRLADRARLRRSLAVLFCLAGAYCAALVPLNDVLGAAPFLAGMTSWPLRTFVHTVLLFVPPAILLGAITPLIAKLALQSGAPAGRAVGGVFACGVAGSIAGTFATGHGLVFIFPVTVIYFSAAAVLVVLGLVCARSARGEVIAQTYAATETPVPTPASNTTNSRSIWWTGIVTVFISNAAFMMLELSAARVLGREFGASIYTWTTVIGVVLAGISLGNYLGGRLADRICSRGTIATMFLGVSITGLAGPAIARWMSGNLQDVEALYSLSWPVQITLFMVVAFFWPNLVIGTISPLVVKRALDSGAAEGRTVGAIYAWGSVGSIFGTFAAGYVLIGWMGSLSLIAATSLLLALTAMVWSPKGVVAGAWSGLCILALLAAVLPLGPAEAIGRFLGLRSPVDPARIFETESNYSYIAIRTLNDDPNHREMILDKLTHSQVDLDDLTDLKYEYEWIYDGVIGLLRPAPAPVNAMIIGGGGYAYPNYLERVRPESYIEASEIDPQVTETAFEYFGLPRDTGIAIFNQDARNRIAEIIRELDNGNTPDFMPFDFIFGDSINDYSVPQHLTTIEFATQIHRLLADDGVYLLNMIDMLDVGGFLSAVVHTNRQVFPYVYVLNTGRPADVRDTFVVVNAKQPVNLQEVAAKIRVEYPFAGNLIPVQTLDELIERHGEILLTDRYTPVENLLKPVARSRGRDPGEAKLVRAERLAEEGDLAGATAACRAALEIRPLWPEALRLLGRLLAAQGEIDPALEAFQQAAQLSPEPADIKFDLVNTLLDADRAEEGSVALNAMIDQHPEHAPALQKRAVLAMNAQDYRGAIALLTRAITAAPEFAIAYYNLGLAHAGLQDLGKAISSWERSAALAPEHLDTLYNLAVAYTATQQFEQAWGMVDRLRDLGEEPDPGLLQTLQQQAPR